MRGGNIIIRDPNIAPPKVRNLLKQIGNEKVNTITLFRYPLKQFDIGNILTAGDLQRKINQLGIDKLFHLGMVINNAYLLEKNQVINMERKNVPPDSETLEIPVPDGIVISELIERTQRLMGNRFGPYDVRDNNCSVFISSILRANNLSTANSDKFVNQRTEELFNLFHPGVKGAIDTATTAAAIADRQIQGEGNGLEYQHNYGLPVYTLYF